ncbi:hypothetical protein [Brevibacterium renqingii]|uniref:hypothetical protein n=1 Tax=Brevibacterium renqingii TaxID=2776916 RepID=UPI001AE0DBBB|nr:hypothetical protein [Brevibacterium renqingii]
MTQEADKNVVFTVIGALIHRQQADPSAQSLDFPDSARGADVATAAGRERTLVKVEELLGKNEVV